MITSKHARLAAAIAIVATTVALAVPSFGDVSPNWIKEAPPTSPPGRMSAAMAFDAHANRVVLFGGYSVAHNPNYLNDTWTWDGTDWRLEPGGPPARAYSTMAYDGANGKVLLYGGRDGRTALDDTWEWESGTRQWTKLNVTGPPARENAVMAYDGAQNVVLFGGDSAANLGETWLWNGSSWAEAHPDHSPAPQFDAKMAFDGARQKVVLLARAVVNGPFETWTWTGSDWHQESAPSGSPSGTSGAMAYDPRAGTVLMFESTITTDGCGLSGGYQVSSCPVNRTWAWDGSDWQKRDPSDAPGPRDFAVMAQNPAPSAGDRSVVLFGGRAGFTYLDETWTWDSGFRPAPQVSGIAPASGSTLGNEQVTITGSHLAGATQVHFGADAVLNCPAACQINGDSEIKVNTPPHVAATVQVVVTTPDGSSNALDYKFVAPVAPAPTVDRLDPGARYTTGGEPVAIFGTNLLGATKVHFGADPSAELGCPSASCTVTSDTRIDVLTPAHPADTVHVVVETPAGASAPTDNDRFSFVTAPVPAPAVTKVDPDRGPTDGGQQVSLFGTHLGGATLVRFGDDIAGRVNCPSDKCTLVSDAVLTVVTPPHAAATVHVVVSTAGGGSAPTAQDQYTYFPGSAPGGGFQVAGEPAIAQPSSQSPFQAAPPGGSPVGGPTGGLVTSPAGSAPTAGVAVAPGSTVGFVPSFGGSINVGGVPGALLPPPPPVAGPVGTSAGAHGGPGAPGSAQGGVPGSSGAAAGGRDQVADPAPHYMMVAAAVTAVVAFGCASVVIGRPARKRRPCPARAV